MINIISSFEHNLTQLHTLPSNFSREGLTHVFKIFIFSAMFC